MCYVYYTLVIVSGPDNIYCKSIFIHFSFTTTILYLHFFPIANKTDLMWLIAKRFNKYLLVVFEYIQFEVLWFEGRKKNKIRDTVSCFKKGNLIHESLAANIFI